MHRIILFFLFLFLFSYRNIAGDCVFLSLL